MPVATQVEKEFTYVFFDYQTSIDDLKRFQFQNADSLKNINVLYDFRAFDLSNINFNEIYYHICDIVNLYDNKKTRKRALLHSSKQGVLIGNIVVFYVSYKMNFIYENFTNKDEAINWLIN